MKRLDWLTLWDRLREELPKRTSWGSVQIKDLMDRLERDMVRELERTEHE